MRAFPKHPWFADLAWLIVGLGLFFGLMLRLERHSRYFFTQDDNISQFLPVMRQAMRGVEEGRFPAWNPHQFMGAPTASVGTYALTYPGTYLSWWAARCLGDEYLFLEIFCVAHLAAGLVACHVANRMAGASPPMAMAGAFAFVASGFFLMIGRSWYYVTPTALWLPVLVALLLWWRTHPVGWKWAVASGGSVGLFFHAGNAQFWIYGMMYCAILAALFLVRMPDRKPKAWAVLAAMLGGIGLAIPLAGVQAWETAGVSRAAEGMATSLLTLVRLVFAPFLVRDGAEVPWLEAKSAMVYYHVSTILSLGMVAGCFLSLRKGQRTFPVPLWPFAAVWGVALLLTTGDEGFLWPFMARFPPFDRFQWPFKHAIFASFFLMVSGTAAWSALARLPGLRPPLLAVPALWVVLVTIHRDWSFNRALFRYGFYPYPPLLERQAAAFEKQDGRVASLLPDRMSNWTFSQGLPLNMPTAYSVPAWGGYDPLVSEQAEHRDMRARLLGAPDATEALRAWGVRWVLVGHEPALGIAWPFPPGALAGVTTLYQDKTWTGEGLRLMELKDPAPLAAFVDDAHAKVGLGLHTGGGWVDTHGRPGDLMVNILHRQGLRFEDEHGRPLPYRPDAWQRVVVSVPPAAKRVEIRYAPPWRLFCGMGFLCVLAGTGLWSIRFRWHACENAWEPRMSRRSAS